MKIRTRFFFTHNDVQIYPNDSIFIQCFHYIANGGQKQGVTTCVPRFYLLATITLDRRVIGVSGG